MSEMIAKVTDLKVHYPIRKDFFSFGKTHTLKAVDGVSLNLKHGEILGLVGESGCGKSSLGRALIRLIKPTSGSIEIQGTDFLSKKGKELQKVQPFIQMIFQDPYASLDPRMTVYDILEEPVTVHLKLSKKEIEQRIFKYLDLVGLPLRSLKKYPHEFSGGQRQRICIARALILEPKIIIADEPVSALDVSVQAQILNLLKDIQQKLNLSMIFISHNLAVMKYISDRIAVMYLGKIVEIGQTKDIFTNPLHPYTKALIASVPIPDPRTERNRPHTPLVGDLPSPVYPPPGCTFHTRCPIAKERCKETIPTLEAKPNSSSLAACIEV